MSSDGEDSALVQRAIAGDSVALKLLLVHSHKRIGRQIARRIPASLQKVIDIEDVIQETHIEVFQRIAGFEPRGDGAFDAWITAIAVSRLTNAIKKHRAAKRGGLALSPMNQRIEDSTIALLDTLAGPGRTPSQSVARGEAIEAVHAALDELPEHYREAVWLVYIEGRPVKEAAVQMDRTERAVHGLCRRGLRALRDRLQSATSLLSTTG